MRIIYENNVFDSVISTNSVDLNYPLENIQDTRLSRLYRSETKTGVEIDLYNENIDKELNYIFLLNDNLTATATVTIEANTVDSFTSPPFSKSLTYENGFYSAYFTDALDTYKYWRLTITDTSNTNDYIQIGMVIIGDYLQLPAMKQDQSFPTVTKSRKSISNSGQVYGSKRYKYKPVKANFPFVSRQQKTDIESMFDEVENYQPILMLMYESDLSILAPLYCTLDSDTLKMDRNGTTLLPFKSSFDFIQAF